MPLRVYDALRLNIFLYPGIVEFRAADFLKPYYRWRRAKLGPASIAFNAIVYAAIWVWIPARTRAAARTWAKDRAWQDRAIPLARRWITDPFDLAIFGIDDEAGLRTVLRRMEQVAIIRSIENSGSDHGDEILDKLKFQLACERHSLPIPLLFGTIRNGRFEGRHPLLKGGEVLVKPVRGSGGRGIGLCPAEAFECSSALPSAYRRGHWLVQECAKVHPAISDIALDTLVTLRITTIRNENGDPEVVSATLRYPVQEGVIVDNGHAGGLIAPVNMDTSLLGEGLSGWHPGRYPVHPKTGGMIQGRQLPDWTASLDLARDAHARLFPDQVIVGWDIGVAEGGPVLIEANQRPAVRLTQRASGMGIGQMRYGQLLAWHLERAVREDRRTRRFLTRS